jgi:uncharacterized membrane protein
LASSTRGRRRRLTGLARIRQLFLTGLAIITPLFITIWVLNILLGIVQGVSTRIVLAVLRVFGTRVVDDPTFAYYAVPLIGLVATLLVIVMVGALATNLIGRQLVSSFDRVMLRIPLIKGIYGAARQLLDAFSAQSGTFRRVVAIEYPRPGCLTVGFVAQEGATLVAGDRKKLAGRTLIFLPTTPNPTSGWLAVVPDEEVIPLDLSVEEGLKLVVSGGIVLPRTWSEK